jgi:uncharacterized protein DUF3108
MNKREAASRKYGIAVLAVSVAVLHLAWLEALPPAPAAKPSTSRLSARLMAMPPTDTSPPSNTPRAATTRQLAKSAAAARIFSKPATGTQEGSLTATASTTRATGPSSSPGSPVASMPLPTQSLEETPGSQTLAAGMAPPLYPARMPPPLHWRYHFVRNGTEGRADLVWQPEGNAYQAHMTGEADSRLVFEWWSSGQIDVHGAAPQRHRDHRRGRSTRSVEFEREGVPRIVYASGEQALPDGTQDRLSLLLQIAGIVNADPTRWTAGQEIQLVVSSTRDAQIWRFQVVGAELLALQGAAPMPTLKLIREPDAPYALQVQLWLDPNRSHLPVRIRFRNESSLWELTLSDKSS